ncbi:hypothetical protein DDB_G0270966 [Dictyostelium discoideum AX4]|uniref:Ribonuclease H2 subunit B n=1 Tax=Dictyostelium discoideum TaxID=44689 RepID=Q55D33_DICDI|nr:hypothetical protein DDB_G0270966 [Dictyostelium discoideum AX4]EAL72833.1 hypothetical protein DDB_G0270966 [Dictyostelium discoideum AX4]|eukprot:XP_646298.1 hypothetical protein DDB_G0270966 [Dictyostelium discoideum AX4]
MTSKIDEIDIDNGEEVFEEIEDFEDEDSDDGVSKSKSDSNRKRKVSTPALKPHPPIPKLPYNDRVFIIQQPKNDTNIIDYEILTLPSPKHKSVKCRYILDKENDRILEINKFNSKPSSWFIDNGVRHDGSMYLSSDIDPLFLLIPFLEKYKSLHKNEYLEISSIINDSYYCNLSKIPFKHSQLSLICDSKEIAGSKLYRLEDEKLLIWLRCKVKNISNYLKETNTDIFKTSNYVKKDLSWETLYTMSIGFVSEYLSESNCKMLNQSFNLLSATAQQTIKSESEYLVYTERIIDEPEPPKSKRGASKKAPAKKSPVKGGGISNFLSLKNDTPTPITVPSLKPSKKSEPIIPTTTTIAAETKGKITDFFTKIT